jgi:hypothetical protein
MQILVCCKIKIGIRDARSLACKYYVTVLVPFGVFMQEVFADQEFMNSELHFLDKLFFLRLV